MNREELFAAMNGIKDEYIAEADPAVAAPIPIGRRLKPFLTMAAAMAIVVGIVAMSGNLDKTSSDAVMEEAATAESVETASVTAGAPEAYAEEGAAPAAAEDTTEEAAAEEPAEAAVEDMEEAAMGQHSEEKAAEVEVAEAESAEEAQRIDFTEVFWNGVSYAYDAEVTELPEGFTEAGSLEDDPAAEFYSDYAHDHNTVYTSEEDLTCIYVETELGFRRYLKS